MQQVIPAAIAFFALGAVFLASVLLLLFNPRNRGVRAYVVFQVGLMVWLGSQGWAFAANAWPRVGPIISASVDLLPALFLAYVIVQVWNRPTREVLFMILLGFAILPVTLGFVLPAYSGPVRAIWHIAGWGAGTLLQFRFLRSRLGPAAQSASRRRLGAGVSAMFVVLAPMVLIGSILFGAATFDYAMPLIVVWIQILVFVGVTHLRYYDIEVRATRTGELLSGAAEVERMALVGELSASLAHEIRNPLTGVRSLAQRLAEEEVDEPRRKRYASVILDETARVEGLVSNLLAVARRAPPETPGGTSVPVGPLLEDLLLLVTSRAQKAGVTLVAAETDLIVRARRERLAQVLLNGLLNAIQHSPRAGTVHLLAAGVGDGVEFRIRDSGAGIPAAERDRVWEPFHSTSGGTGLGLAIVRRIAREEGWEVGLETAPAGGVDFVVRVPTPIDAPTAASPHRLPLEAGR